MKNILLITFIFALTFCHAKPVRFGGLTRNDMIETNGVPVEIFSVETNKMWTAIENVEPGTVQETDPVALPVAQEAQEAAQALFDLWTRFCAKVKRTLDRLKTQGAKVTTGIENGKIRTNIKIKIGNDYYSATEYDALLDMDGIIEVIDDGINITTNFYYKGAEVATTPRVGAIENRLRLPLVVGTQYNPGNTTATSGADIAVGSPAYATGKNSIAIGSYAEAHYDYSTAIGCNSFSAGPRATAYGYEAWATTNNTVAIGARAKARELNSTALGFQTKAEHLYSISIGANAISYEYGGISFKTPVVDGFSVFRINGKRITDYFATKAEIPEVNVYYDRGTNFVHRTYFSNFVWYIESEEIINE